MISQQQTQKQQLKILPQQIQLLNLYFLNSLELEQRIKNELEENPFLDAQNEEQATEAESKVSDVQERSRLLPQYHAEKRAGFA